MAVSLAEVPADGKGAVSEASRLQFGRGLLRYPAGVIIGTDPQAITMQQAKNRAADV